MATRWHEGGFGGQPADDFRAFGNIVSAALHGPAPDRQLGVERAVAKAANVLCDCNKLARSACPRRKASPSESMHGGPATKRLMVES